MITRIYIDNFLSFVNFEWHPGPFTLILGVNGSGKTNLLNVLISLQAFIQGDNSVTESFPSHSKTRWDSRSEQILELDVVTSNGLATYRLVVDHNIKEQKIRIKEESVRIGERYLISCMLGNLQLYRDDGEKGPSITVSWSRSMLSTASESADATHLMAFKKAMQCLWFLAPDARSIHARLADKPMNWLKSDLSNFSDWYLQTIKSKPGTIFKAMRDLSNILDGFIELYEERGRLNVRFDWQGQTFSFSLDELSEGQRALIALYVIRHVVAISGNLLALDEPDNYIALAEIQPILLQLQRAALKTDGPQIWLISHHPESLNLLAVAYGWRFFRENGGPTRVERFKSADTISPAETVARGWE